MLPFDRHALKGIAHELALGTGHVRAGATVAEVVADLALDRRAGQRGEVAMAGGVEAVDRLDEPDGPDLDEVVERLAAVEVAAGDGAHERQVRLDRLAAGAQPR